MLKTKPYFSFRESAKALSEWKNPMISFAFMKQKFEPLSL